MTATLTQRYITATTKNLDAASEDDVWPYLRQKAKPRPQAE